MGYDHQNFDIFFGCTLLTNMLKQRSVMEAVKSLEIPAFPKLIFQDSFCVISFLDAQDKFPKPSKPAGFGNFSCLFRTL